MIDERLLCQCVLPCSNKATAEDFRCDLCRRSSDSVCAHSYPVGADEEPQSSWPRSKPIGMVKVEGLGDYCVSLPMPE